MIPITSLQDGTSLNANERVCTVTSPENIPIPNGHLRKEMRLQNIWHRATYIIVRNTFDVTGDDTPPIIVQKRSKFKDFGPGMLDAAPGGVVGFGETYEENALREINEEMGIDISKKNIQNNQLFHLFQFSYEDDRVRVFGECFEAIYNGPIESLVLQESEVERVFAISKAELNQRIRDHPEDFLPDSLHAIKIYLSKDDWNSQKKLIC